MKQGHIFIKSIGQCYHGYQRNNLIWFYLITLKDTVTISEE